MPLKKNRNHVRETNRRAALQRSFSVISRVRSTYTPRFDFPIHRISSLLSRPVAQSVSSYLGLIFTSFAPRLYFTTSSARTPCPSHTTLRARFPLNNLVCVYHSITHSFSASTTTDSWPRLVSNAIVRQIRESVTTTDTHRV